MIEMPEAYTIANQMKETLPGKTINRFERGNLSHKFLWLNRPLEEYQLILPDKGIKDASSFGRSIYLYLGDYLLWWSDTGGKILYHAPGEVLPKKFHLAWYFTDGSALTFSMRMWGGVKLLGKEAFDQIPHEETGIPPLHPDFTFERFNHMLEDYPEKTSKGIKGFLVATGYVMPNHIQGLGNAIVQDILYQARINPKKKIPEIRATERKNLFNAVQQTVQNAVDLGGRYDEFDLFGNNGRYVRLMDSKTVGTPCPECGTRIEKISYLGGSCYLCPTCQT